MDYYNYHRRLALDIDIGNTPTGCAYPIRLQSMATVSTMDTEAAVSQAIRIIDAGGDFVRFAVRNKRETLNLRFIRKALREKGYDTPLIADVHFNPALADIAALSVEKVRINPGNYLHNARQLEPNFYTDEAYNNELRKIQARFVLFLKLCRKHNTAIRIGVNHGSLSERIMSRYGDTPEGMVESCMEFLRICAEEQFRHVTVSVKSSNTTVMIRTVRLLARTMEAEGMHYPLHLGVTEAGEGEDGRIKSAAGIGTLLADGYGDTIRVSLSEAPEKELPVARKLVDYVTARRNHPRIWNRLGVWFDPINPVRRKSRTVCGIGGESQPVVISDRRNGNRHLNKDLCPDWIFATPEAIFDGFFAIPDSLSSYSDGLAANSGTSEKVDPEGVPFRGKYIVEAKLWKPQPDVYPCFTVSETKELQKSQSKVKFISLTLSDLSDDVLHLLKTSKNLVVIASSSHINYIGEMRAFLFRLFTKSCDVPVILCNEYTDTDMESIQIKAAADFGALLIDGFGDGLLLNNPQKPSDPSENPSNKPQALDTCMFGILQAARVRISKTEYISCPGCGRTLFDLQATVAQVKAATAHKKGLKIAIMGCIVNGPGEMADADYGYVGSGRGRINLYKGKTCIQKNIPEKEAVKSLLNLINNDHKNTGQ